MVVPEKHQLRQQEKAREEANQRARHAPAGAAERRTPERQAAEHPDQRTRRRQRVTSPEREIADHELAGESRAERRPKRRFGFHPAGFGAPQLASSSHETSSTCWSLTMFATQSRSLMPPTRTE
jgi:hypothetical protein